HLRARVRGLPLFRRTAHRAVSVPVGQADRQDRRCAAAAARDARVAGPPDTGGARHAQPGHGGSVRRHRHRSQPLLPRRPGRRRRDDPPSQRMTGFLARPVALRWLGFFGSVCCAIDGFLFGAARSIRPDVTVWSILRGPNGVIIMLLWVVGLVAICTAWWKGRHLVGRGILTPRWVLVTAALWILPMIFIPPLASRDMYAYACQGALFGSGHNPYHDSISAQPCPWIDSVSVRWRFTLTPYGPLFIPLSAIAAKLGSLTAAIAAFRALAVISVAGMAAGMYALARRAGVPVDRALWLLMCCPLVPLHLVAGGHNDGLTVAFLVAGFALIIGADRGYPALLAGGALLGLSMSVKTTIGLVLPFAALLAAGGFAAGGWSRLLRRGGAVLAGALGTLLVLSAAT